MFCPTCGSEERQASQFCRACGVDLRAVRLSLERPDTVTASAASAREEIGRAVAEKIRSVEGAGELKVVADSVLPGVEKFLESPEEKRLRRLRAGVITGLIGLGTTVPAIALTSAVRSEDLFVVLMMIVLGSVAFTVGLALVINGLLFTRPRKTVKDKSGEVRSQKLVDHQYMPPLKSPTTSNLAQSGNSVTEHTTLHLKADR